MPRPAAPARAGKNKNAEAPKVRLARVGEAQMAKLMPLLTELTRNENNLNQLAKQAAQRGNLHRCILPARYFA